MKKIILISTGVVLLAGVGGFFGGMKYQQSKQSVFPNLNIERKQGIRGQFNQRIGSQGLRPVSGTVISRDDDSLTVKLADGGSKIIFLTENSTINKTEETSKEELLVGKKIVVFGQENPDGSITAENVQLNPTIQYRSNENQN